MRIAVLVIVVASVACSSHPITTGGNGGSSGSGGSGGTSALTVV
jgi:hypothetical protein